MANSRKIATFSFDDGGVEDLVILEIFRDLGWLATYYITSAWLSDLPRSYGCSKQELIASYGDSEIGSHTVSHPHLSLAAFDKTLYELRESKRVIESVFEKPCTVFAYPYGSIGVDTERLLTKLNYTWARGIQRDLTPNNLRMPIDVMFYSEQEEALLEARIADGLPIHVLCHSWMIVRNGQKTQLISWMAKLRDAGYIVMTNSQFFQALRA